MNPSRFSPNNAARARLAQLGGDTPGAARPARTGADTSALASSPASPGRRVLLAGAGALVAAQSWPAFAQLQTNLNELPPLPAMEEFIAGRRVQFARMQMEIPRVADNGNSVPIKLGVLGAIKPGAVQSIHLFSEKNPVPRMAVFHFPPATSRFDLESRVRLAGTQRIVAIATLADGTLCVKVAEVLVAIAACLDGS